MHRLHTWILRYPKISQDLTEPLFAEVNRPRLSTDHKDTTLRHGEPLLNFPASDYPVECGIVVSAECSIKASMMSEELGTMEVLRRVLLSVVLLMLEIDGQTTPCCKDYVHA